MHHLGHLNPWVVKRWEQENQYAMTLHTKRANIRSLGSRAQGKDDEAAEAAIASLARILTEEDLPLARIEAARALGQTPRPSAAAALGQAMSDSEAEVRIAACDALGKQAQSASIPVLQNVINSDTENDVRLAAARALGNIEDPAAVKALALALEDRSPALQYRAVESLKQITGENFEGDVDQWRSYVQGDVVLDRDPPGLAERLGKLFR